MGEDRRELGRNRRCGGGAVGAGNSERAHGDRRYPAWVISAEDGYDYDFNDFTLACRADVSCQLLDSPPPNGLLDDLAVEYALRELAEDSGLFGPANDFTEQMAYVVQRGNAIYTVKATPQPPLSSCMVRPDPSTLDAINNDPNAFLRAIVHTHPYDGGSSLPVPENCWTMRDDGTIYLEEAGKMVFFRTGPADPDWAPWNGSVERTYEGWVLSPTRLWRWYQVGGPIVFTVVFDDHGLAQGAGACVL